MKNMLLFGVTAALMGGCASQPAPTEHLASSMAAVRTAQAQGAPQVPEAALQLKIAQEELAQAKTMMKNGDNERADYMAVRAYNDATLAIALTREEAARRRAQQAAEVARAAENPNP